MRLYLPLESDVVVASWLPWEPLLLSVYAVTVAPVMGPALTTPLIPPEPADELDDELAPPEQAEMNITESNRYTYRIETLLFMDRNPIGFCLGILNT